MAPRKRKSDNPETVTNVPAPPTVKATHFIRYTDEDGQEIEAGFASENHANVLHHRLKAHGIPHEYDVPE